MKVGCYVSFYCKKLRRNLAIFSRNSPENVEFYEPLSEKSLKHKRALLVSSVGIIVVQSLGIEVQSVLGIKFTKVTNVSDVAGVLFWFMFYQSLTYTLSFWADIKVWNFKRSIFRLHDVLSANVDMHEQLYKTAQSLSVQYRSISTLRAISNGQTYDMDRVTTNLKSIANSLDNTLKGISGDSEIRMTLKQATDKINQCLNDLDTTPTILKLKLFVTFIMDYSIPLLLAIFSFFISYSDGLSVLMRVTATGFG